MANIFEQVRNRVSISDAVAFLGLKPTKREGDQLRFECPNCRGTNKRALSVNVDKGFRCFASSKSGNDATALVAHCRGISQREAAEILVDHFRLAEVQPGGSKVLTDASKSDVAGNMQPLDYLETDHEIVEVLGLTPRALEILGGGYAPKGTMAGRLLIPLRVASGTLVGYLGIATRDDQEPLLLFPPDLEAKAQAAEKPAEDIRKRLRLVASK